MAFKQYTVYSVYSAVVPVALSKVTPKTRDAFDQRTPIFDKFHKNKAGTPVGGGLLIIAITTILFPLVLLLMKYF